MEQGRGRHRLGEAISERLKVKSSSFAKTPISPINSSQQSQTKRECDAGANIPKEGKRQEGDQTLGKTVTDFERAFFTWLNKTLARPHPNPLLVCFAPMYNERGFRFPAD